MDLEDAFRRTSLLVGEELGWSPARAEREVERSLARRARCDLWRDELAAS